MLKPSQEDTGAHEAILWNAALHTIIVNSKLHPHNTENRIICFVVEPSEVSKIFSWPSTVRKKVKLAIFQFKINHNMVYTKDKLKNNIW